MESCVGAGDIMGVAVPDAAPIEYGDAPAAATNFIRLRALLTVRNRQRHYWSLRVYQFS